MNGTVSEADVARTRAITKKEYFVALVNNRSS